MSLPALFLQAAGPSSSQSMLLSVAPFLAILLIFYFFIIRPQNKKQKDMEKMLKALKKGDKVVTIGGIHGVVSSVKESTVVLRIDENVRVEFNRSAVSTVVPKGGADAKADTADEAKDSSSESK